MRASDERFTPSHELDMSSTDPESGAAIGGLITVVQGYGAYYGYRHRTLPGAQPVVDTLPKRTVSDREVYAILAPGQAAGVLETDEGGLSTILGKRSSFLHRVKNPLDPPVNSLVINPVDAPGVPETIEDTEANRQILEAGGVSIVPFTYLPAHTIDDKFPMTVFKQVS